MTIAVNAFPARIGLVDDDPSIRRAVDRLLRSHGYACTTYESAESALADPEMRSLDCLVLDIQLPAINGFGLRDRLQTMGLRVPHLFITAHAETESTEWCEQIGDSPYLTKPFEEAQLISLLEVLVATRSR
jgi:FixJ family two-component response regulator